MFELASVHAHWVLFKGPWRNDLKYNNLDLLNAPLPLHPTLTPPPWILQRRNQVAEKQVLAAPTFWKLRAETASSSAFVLPVNRKHHLYGNTFRWNTPPLSHACFLVLKGLLSVLILPSASGTKIRRLVRWIRGQHFLPCMTLCSRDSAHFLSSKQPVGDSVCGGNCYAVGDNCAVSFRVLGEYWRAILF